MLLLTYMSGEHASVISKLKFPEGIVTKIEMGQHTITLQEFMTLPDFMDTESWKNILMGECCSISEKMTQQDREKVCDDKVKKITEAIRAGHLTKCLELVRKERINIKECQHRGVDPSAYYKAHGSQLNREYTEAEGLNYIKYSLGDVDHFQPGAEIAYCTHRDLAFKYAKQAHQELNPEMKQKPFTYACVVLALGHHYYEDAFSAGHIATPRVPLIKQCGLLWGSLLAKEQHDEANELGLKCKNKAGQKWMVFGDGHLLDQANKDNYKILKKGVYQDFKNLLAAYEGKENDRREAEEFIPEAFPQKEQPNCHPLFILSEAEDKKERVLLRRTEVNNPSCSSYTDQWHAIPTLIKRWLHTREIEEQYLKLGQYQDAISVQEPNDHVKQFNTSYTILRDALKDCPKPKTRLMSAIGFGLSSLGMLCGGSLGIGIGMIALGIGIGMIGAISLPVLPVLALLCIGGCIFGLKLGFSLYRWVADKQSHKLDQKIWEHQQSLEQRYAKLTEEQKELDTDNSAQAEISSQGTDCEEDINDRSSTSSPEDQDYYTPPSTPPLLRSSSTYSIFSECYLNLNRNNHDRAASNQSSIQHPISAIVH